MARIVYVAWALAAWLFIAFIMLNRDSDPGVGTLALLVITSALLGTLGVRAWRLTFEVWPHRVAVRNLFRSYNIPASELRAASFDGGAAVAPGLPGRAAEVECLRLEVARSPYSVDVMATMWLPADEKRALLRRLQQMIKDH